MQKKNNFNDIHKIEAQQIRRLAIQTMKEMLRW